MFESRTTHQENRRKSTACERRLVDEAPSNAHNGYDCVHLCADQGEAMAYVEQLKSGRFRAMARHKACYESSTFDRRDEAEKWAEATERRMKDGKWRQPVVAKAVVRTLAQAYDEYRKSDAYLALAETTRRADKHRHKPVIEALGDKRLADLTEEDVLAYIATRPRENHPAGTTHFVMIECFGRGR